MFEQELRQKFLLILRLFFLILLGCSILALVLLIIRCDWFGAEQKKALPLPIEVNSRQSKLIADKPGNISTSSSATTKTSSHATRDNKVSRVANELLANRITNLVDDSIAYSKRDLHHIDAMHSLLMLGGSVSSDIKSIRHKWLLERVLNGDKFSIPFLIRSNSPYPRRRGGLEGSRESHPNQYLHILSMLSLEKEIVIRIAHKTFTLNDLIKQSKLECRLNGEMDWTVSAYAYYCANDLPWLNKFGETISFESVVTQLLNQKEFSCNGAHRWLALARFMNYTESTSERNIISLRAQVYDLLNEAIADVCSRQRKSGAFASIKWLNMKDTASERELLYLDVHSTGHSLEWMLTFLGSEALENPCISKAITSLVSDTEELLQIIKNETGEFNPGTRGEFTALCHAVSALNIYKNLLEQNNWLQREYP